MKVRSGFSFFLFFTFSIIVYGQKEATPTPFSISANYLYGSIIEHSPNIAHLITGHPEGILISYDRKAFGKESWQRYYNYPDAGFSFLFQDMKNPHLGDNYGIYAHYGFYFLNRNLLLKIGTGLAYNTNPYNENSNFRNNVYGSHLTSSSFLMFNYKHRFFNTLGIQAGITLVHYSNGNVKAPNTSTNSFLFNLGLNYLIASTPLPEYIPSKKSKSYVEPLHYNLVFRGGVNSSDIIGMGQFPFYIFSFYVDKRLSYKSTILAGTEIYFSEMLEELIKFRSIAYPDEGTSGDEDSKRIGVFAGYQLNISRISVFVNLGYYLYYPYDFEDRVYNRLGLKYAISKNWFVGVSVHSHAAKAEAAEFMVGYRL